MVVADVERVLSVAGDEEVGTLLAPGGQVTAMRSRWEANRASNRPMPTR